MSYDFARARRWLFALGMVLLLLIGLALRLGREPDVQTGADQEAAQLLMQHQVAPLGSSPDAVKRAAKAAGADTLTRIFVAEAPRARAGTLRWLVKAGADPKRISAPEREQLVMALSGSSPHDRLLYLIELGFDPRVSDALSGETPMHRAAASGADDATIRLLVKKGVAASQPMRDGRTPLHLAAPSAVPALVAAGADLEARDGDGRTPLMAAVVAGRNLSAQALITAGASVHSTDTRGRTALHLAYDRGPKDMIDLLESAGAARTARDRDGLRPGERSYDSRR